MRKAKRLSAAGTARPEPGLFLKRTVVASVCVSGRNSDRNTFSQEGLITASAGRSWCVCEYRAVGRDRILICDFFRSRFGSFFITFVAFACANIVRVSVCYTKQLSCPLLFSTQRFAWVWALFMCVLVFSFLRASVTASGTDLQARFSFTRTGEVDRSGPWEKRSKKQPETECAAKINENLRASFVRVRARKRTKEGQQCRFTRWVQVCYDYLMSTGGDCSS